MSESNTADREIIITRVFDAPRELVFGAWTDPEHIGEWWGPDGWTIKTHSIDVRPGGEWRYVMCGPNDLQFENRTIFDEIVEPERLVYRQDSGIENDPNQFHVTATFEAQGRQTKLTLRSVFLTAAVRDLVVREFGAIEGGKQMLSKLATYLQHKT